MINFGGLLEELRDSKYSDGRRGGNCAKCPLRASYWKRDFLLGDSSNHVRIDAEVETRLGIQNCYYSACFKRYAEYALVFKENKEFAFLKRLGDPMYFCFTIHSIIDDRIKIYKNKAEIE